MERNQNPCLEQEWDPRVFWIFRSLVLILFCLIRCGEDSEHFFGTRMGPKSVLNLQKLNTDSVFFWADVARIQKTLFEQELDPNVFWIFRSLILILLFLIRCAKGSEHFFEQERDPKVFWVFRSLILIVLDQMRRGFRTLFWNANGTQECSESSEA